MPKQRGVWKICWHRNVYLTRSAAGNCWNWFLVITTLSVPMTGILGRPEVISALAICPVLPSPPRVHRRLYSSMASELCHTRSLMWRSGGTTGASFLWSSALCYFCWDCILHSFNQKYWKYLAFTGKLTIKQFWYKLNCRIWINWINKDFVFCTF